LIYIVLNAVPILVATLAGLAIGGLFRRLSGLPQPTTGFAATALLAEAWFCAILAGALILAPAKAGDWTMAIGSAVVIWIGFVVPVLVVSLGVRRVRPAGIAGDAAHWLAVMLAQAVILKSIGLVSPPV
jgi:hypothetical protein